MNNACAGAFENVPLTEAAIMEGSKGSGFVVSTIEAMLE